MAVSKASSKASSCGPLTPTPLEFPELRPGAQVAVWERTHDMHAHVGEVVRVAVHWLGQDRRYQVGVMMGPQGDALQLEWFANTSLVRVSSMPVPLRNVGHLSVSFRRKAEVYRRTFQVHDCEALVESLLRRCTALDREDKYKAACFNYCMAFHEELVQLPEPVPSTEKSLLEHWNDAMVAMLHRNWSSDEVGFQARLMKERIVRHCRAWEKSGVAHFRGPPRPGDLVRNPGFRGLLGLVTDRWGPFCTVYVDRPGAYKTMVIDTSSLAISHRYGPSRWGCTRQLHIGDFVTVVGFHLDGSWPENGEGTIAAMRPPQDGDGDQPCIVRFGGSKETVVPARFLMWGSHDSPFAVSFRALPWASSIAKARLATRPSHISPCFEVLVKGTVEYQVLFFKGTFYLQGPHYRCPFAKLQRNWTLETRDRAVMIIASGFPIFVEILDRVLSDACVLHLSTMIAVYRLVAKLAAESLGMRYCTEGIL